ncbi:hypothetical protein [Amycolatopsis sp. NPDC058986]|uniref:hypothetical protein n=1 Tax=unclassified Amycolatopsis TaxID=2618356 RepID=UPI00366D1C62
MTSATRIVRAARECLGDHPHAEQAVMRLLVDRLAARRGHTPPAWPALPTRVEETTLEQARTRLQALDLARWEFHDVGAAYEHLLGLTGAWYTPPVLAEATVRLSLQPQLDRLAEHPDPGNVLQALTLDPACGAGVVLTVAARAIAARYAERLFGEATELTVAIVLPEVLSESIFGVDVDPVAVELAKAALWFEARGMLPITYLDRNIVCADTLSGPTAIPPRLAERHAAGAGR